MHNFLVQVSTLSVTSITLCTFSQSSFFHVFLLSSYNKKTDFRNVQYKMLQRHFTEISYTTKQIDIEEMKMLQKRFTLSWKMCAILLKLLQYFRNILHLHAAWLLATLHSSQLCYKKHNNQQNLAETTPKTYSTLAAHCMNYMIRIMHRKITNNSTISTRVQTPGYIPKKTRWVFLGTPT